MMNCPECGAPDQLCQSRFDECLALEFTDAGYGTVHHLTVAAYMVQHSSRLTRGGWLQGQLSGRQPLLHHRKALIMTPTFFRERDYRDSGCGAAIERLVDDFGFRYPGVEQVEHVYFYAVNAADEETRREYLQQAYRLGHEFESSLVAAPAPTGQPRGGVDRETVEGGVR